MSNKTMAEVLAENEALKKALAEQKVKTPSGDISFKISPKGAVSIYRLQRFPVTLYKAQWLKLLNNVEKLRAFLDTVPDTAPVSTEVSETGDAA